MTPHMRKKWDEKIAAEWPELWARANSGTKGSKRRSALRKEFMAAHQLEKFKESNPSARCATCRHCMPYTPREGEHFCDIQSDFRGYQLTGLDDVCAHWSPTPKESPDA